MDDRYSYSNTPSTPVAFSSSAQDDYQEDSSMCFGGASTDLESLAASEYGVLFQTIQLENIPTVCQSDRIDYRYHAYDSTNDTSSTDVLLAMTENIFNEQVQLGERARAEKQAIENEQYRKRAIEKAKRDEEEKRLQAEANQINL